MIKPTNRQAMIITDIISCGLTMGANTLQDCLSNWEHMAQCVPFGEQEKYLRDGHEAMRVILWGTEGPVPDGEKDRFEDIHEVAKWRDEKLPMTPTYQFDSVLRQRDDYRKEVEDLKK